MPISFAVRMTLKAISPRFAIKIFRMGWGTIGFKIKGGKKGKRFLSHRYNRLPLLPSGPGGVDGSWS